MPPLSFACTMMPFAQPYVMTPSHDQLKLMQANCQFTENVCPPAYSPDFHTPYDGHGPCSNSQPTIDCQYFSPQMVHMHSREPAVSFAQSSWPYEGNHLENSAETFHYAPSQGNSLPDHRESQSPLHLHEPIPLFSSVREFKTSCVDPGRDACSVPLSGTATGPRYPPDEKPISPYGHMPSSAGICIPEVPFQIQSPHRASESAVSGHGIQSPPTEPTIPSLDHLDPATVKSMPLPPAIKRSQSALDLSARSHLHDSPLDYYASLPTQTFPTPSELLCELSACGDAAATQLIPQASEIRTEPERSSEPQRKVHHRAVAHSLGFKPTDPDSISSHDKKRHYLECLEQYVLYLHDQLRIIGTEPVPLERVSTYRGLSSRSIRTLLVHMEDNVRKLHHTCLDEEKKFLSLCNRAAREEDLLGAHLSPSSSLNETKR